MSGYPYPYQSPGGYSSGSPATNPYASAYGSGFGGYQDWMNFATSGVDPRMMGMGATYGSSTSDYMHSNIWNMSPGINQQSPMDDNTLIGGFQGIFSQLDSQVAGTSDGVISSNDLNSALKDKTGKYSKHDKPVIQAILNNQDGLRGRLDQMDGKVDGLISQDSVNQLLVDPNAGGGSSTYPQAPMDDNVLMGRFQSIASSLDAQNTGTADGLITTGDLNLAIKDTTGKYSEEDKKVIQAILDNQDGLRGRLDHLDGKDDGMFSIDCINKLVADPTASLVNPVDKMTNTEAIITIANYQEQNGLSDGMSRADVQKIMADSNSSPELKNAAQKLLNNTELFRTLETADAHGRPDDIFSYKDAMSALDMPDLDTIGVPATTVSTASAISPTSSNNYPASSTMPGYPWGSVGGAPSSTLTA